FPKEIMAQLCERAALPGILGNCHASGTEIISELGDEHIRSGKPICYTSADSVFQVAAYEQEQVPVLVLGWNPSREIGSRSSFSDVGASVAAHLNIPAVSNGRAF